MVYRKNWDASPPKAYVSVEGVDGHGFPNEKSAYFSYGEKGVGQTHKKERGASCGIADFVRGCLVLLRLGCALPD
jgi:hypothetical protein